VKRIAIGLLSAPLLALAQSPVALAPVALFALVPWLWATRQATAVGALALGALVGTLYGCLAAPWIPEALRSLGSSGPAPLLGLVAVAVWAKLALFAAVGGIAWGLRDQPAAAQVLALAIVFALGEQAAGGWSLGVPWAFAGHSQLAVPGVAQLAAVGGVALLSAGLIAINAALALAIGGGARGSEIHQAFAIIPISHGRLRRRRLPAAR